MIAFRGMLVGPAQEAGIKVPVDPDNFDANEYSHWAVYCTMQLGRRIPTMTEHWGNAKIIAGIPEEKIRSVTIEAISALGFQ
jgi:hypothetical protein